MRASFPLFLCTYFVRGRKLAYILCKNNGDSQQVPKVVFDRLANTQDDWIRIALYIISTRNCNIDEIATNLRIKDKEQINKALLFWSGAGLIENDFENDSKECNEKNEIKQTKRVHLTTAQVAQAASENEKIAFLLQECQRLMGKIVTQGDCNIFVSMYLCDAMPIDMILLGVAHFASQGKTSARYVERALLSWQREGINTGSAAEHYLNTLIQCEEYTKRALVVFDKNVTKVNKAESNMICEWFEVYGYDEKMIAEALAHAGERKTIRYVNGILKRWNEEGYKTLKDVIQSSADKMQNLEVSNPNAKNVLSGAIRKAPVFKK